jgi:hypothetical protein
MSEKPLPSFCISKYSSWSGQRGNFTKSAYPSAKTASHPPLRPSTQFSTSPKFLPKHNTSAIPSLFTKITTWFLKISRQKSSKIPLVGKPRTQAARTTLIQSVAAAIPTFTMSTFLLPKTLCKEIDTLLKNFWWGFQKQKHNLTPQAWKEKKNVLPKSLGGLGLKLMSYLNRTLANLG